MKPHQRQHLQRTRAQQAAAVVGVDAGKFRHALVVRRRGEPDSKPLTFATDRDGFEAAVEYITAISGGAAPSEVLVGIEFAGYYGFTLAHYLHQHGFQVVSVLPMHTKANKRIVHGMALKTDQKDAQNITDLVAQGKFTGFPFLRPVYAELRYLVSGRERLSTLRRGCISRLRTTLHIVWPEFETLFQKQLARRTPKALLRVYPGPGDFLAAPRRKVLKLLKEASRGHLGLEMYESLRREAERTLGLASAQGVLREEIVMLLDQLAFYEERMKGLEAKMAALMEPLPEARALQTIPSLTTVTAAIFLGSIGDPGTYSSSKEIVALAGLSLREHSSGVMVGRQRISKSGRPQLRQTAYMFAVRSISHDGIYRAAYDRLLARMGKQYAKKALVALSRDALKLMFSVARDRRTWTPEPPPPPRRNLALTEASA